jgi:2-methylcitrate dehydratase PrpD
MSGPLAAQLLAHAASVRFEGLPAPAVEAAVTFITDSIGVGLAGSRHPRVAEVRAAAAAWGQGDTAQEWTCGTCWPAPTAAMLNAYQVHNQEFDCVHERAVVHPMATILPALLAVAQAEARAVTGAELIAAVVVAVDVAATIGSAQVAPMRFFRPAMCGALGATLGAARLARLDAAQAANALGIAYSQLAGTMQAHVEGSPMLALQVGLAARAAVTAVDLARAGFAGPRDVIEGPFGYFDLFDAPLAPRRAEVEAVFGDLGRCWRIAEVSHKPFPTGRAAHGALDGLATLVAQHGLKAADVQRIELAAPPLVLRLVGRPIQGAMDVNYARLCLPYLAATLLLRGEVGLEDFDEAALRDPARHAFAPRVAWRANDCSDPNALAPQALTVEMSGGAVHRIELPAVLGHPQRSLSAAAQRRKFDACCRFAGLAPERAETLHAACLALPHLQDLRDFALFKT